MEKRLTTTRASTAPTNDMEFPPKRAFDTIVVPEYPALQGVEGRRPNSNATVGIRPVASTAIRLISPGVTSACGTSDASRQRSTSVAFGAKRTLTEPRSERPKIANRAKFCVSIFLLREKPRKMGGLGAYSQNGEYNRYAEDAVE